MSAMLEKYINSGIAVLGNPDNASPRTLIIVGVARGGTSLAAGSLHHLGVFLGDQSAAPVFEDMRLSNAFEQRSSEKPEEIISDYNSRYEVWGWKRPSNLNNLGSLDRILRNPLYIVIFKDVFSIANRNRISMGVIDVYDNISKALDQYRIINDFIAKTRSAKMLVSYDKAVADKELFLNALCDFAGIRSTSEQVEAAKLFITPNPREYYESTRINRVLGYIDVITDSCVSGWSCYAYGDIHRHRPIVVRLVVSGVVRQEATASLFRPDLKQKGISKTGNAGFEFNLPVQQRLKPGDVVEVLAGPENEKLHRSPKGHFEL